MFSRLFTTASLLCATGFCLAQDTRLTDELVVSGERPNGQAIATLPFPVTTLDTSRVLDGLPGASANRNGALTGIAQYRGLFGDRIAISLDGMPVVGGGPNAMDAPMSYATPLMTESVSLERGIVSVSHAEAMGGHVATLTDRGSFGSGDSWKWDGRLAGRFGESGDAASAGGRFTLANAQQRFSLTAEAGEGDDYETSAGTLLPSRFQRDRIDLGYAVQLDEMRAEVFAGRLNTTDSGTPALPMDIRSIDTDLFGASLATELAGWNLQGSFSVNDVDHWMDNFGLRTAPANAMMYRQTHATGQSNAAKLVASTRLDNLQLTLGIDRRNSVHDALITNPNMAMFSVHNFNENQRDGSGAFVELENTEGELAWSVGLRADRVTTGAGAVAATGMMGMMATNANSLAAAFNSADRSLEYSNIDLVTGLRFAAGNGLQLIAQAGSRARAPSYQELYLWLPMQATGGLADGRSYVGNLNLKAERNNELVLGADWNMGRFSLSPRIYYRDVQDYIQGTPSNNMTANMVSNMMSGAGALQFTNQDATISGLDLHWSANLGATRLGGSLSTNRGELADGSDNLYRQAPDRMLTSVTHQLGRVSLAAELELVASQKRVSSYNGETVSAGYGLVHLGASWQFSPALGLTARVDNLLDKAHQPHLAGVNRVMGSDIAAGERIYGTSRAVWLGLDYRFD